MTSPIENFIQEYKELSQYLFENFQITLQTSVGNHFKKVFLLSCASYCEKEIQETISSFVKTHSNDERVLCFTTNKGIERQFHTYFNWKANNVNSFLGLFGSDFKEKISSELISDDAMNENVKAFIEIGRERNLMVHENFLSYNLGLTFEEIEVLKDKSMLFLEFIKTRLE